MIALYTVLFILLRSRAPGRPPRDEPAACSVDTDAEAEPRLSRTEKTRVNGSAAPPGRRACPPVRRTRKSACPTPAPMRSQKRSGRSKEAAHTEPRAMRPGVRRLSKNKEKPAVSEQQGSSRGQGPPRIGSASVRKCRFQAFSGIVFCLPAKYALAKRSQKSPCWTFLTSWEPRAVRPGVRCVGYFMLLYRKVTIWPLVQVALGLKVVAEVPLVIWGS